MTGGHVFDCGASNDGRYYTRGGPLVFHMDPVDVVGLLCLRTARSGGASRIVSAGELHNLIQAERRICSRFSIVASTIVGAGMEATPSARVPVFSEGRHGIECYLLPVTIQQATEEGCPLTPLEEEALAFVEDVANRPGVFLDMDFQVGDIEFLSNRTILHARTDYVDFPEPERKRHLWRLWLMTPHWAPRPAVMNFHDQVDQAGGGVRVR